MALDLTRGLMLVADGLNANDDRGNGQPMLVLGRLIAGQLAQVKGTLLTLLKAAGEMGARVNASRSRRLASATQTRIESFLSTGAKGLGRIA